MDSEADVKEFLKSYVDTMDDKELLQEYAPLNIRIDMAGASCWIEDKKGETLAVMQSSVWLGPSMPVVPHLIGFAKIFVDAANYVLKKDKAPEGE